MSEKSEKFDLSSFELADTATMEVMTKKGDPMEWEGKPVTIEFYGPGSDRSAQWERKQAKEQQDRAMKMARGKTVESDPHKEQADRLAFMTKQINNLPVTPAELFGNRRMMHVSDQAARFLVDLSNF